MGRASIRWTGRWNCTGAARVLRRDKDWCDASASLGLVALSRVELFIVFAFDGDAQGTQEVHIVFGEGATGGFGGRVGFFSLLGDFVEANGGLKHKKHIEPVLADVLDDAGDLFALNDGLVDGFSELLDQFAQA